MKTTTMIDERTERLNGQVSFFVLMLTQIALAAAVFTRRYIQGIDSGEPTIFSVILLASVLTYWGARLYVSGILPVISWKALLGIYVALVLVISIPSALIHGLPTAQNWQSTILPAMLGPAGIVILYWLIAFFGKRRLDRQINE